ALHLGIWELFGSLPRLTADSISDDPRVVAAIDALCGHIGSLVVPLLKSLVDWHIPQHARVQERIHRRVLFFLSEDLALRPSLDFGGLFFTIAVKEGNSEIIHIDWNDNMHKFALIFCAGDYQGGEFCVPQLGVRVPLRPGSVIAARTRLLAHCSAPLSGRRLVFTCFTDSTLLEHTLKGAPFMILK
ncbi:hypothetical protein B0H11DRAFT_1744453, partial [Mycena galericulata]